MLKEKLFIVSFIFLYVAIIFSIRFHKPILATNQTKKSEIVFWQSGAGSERVEAIKTLIAKFEKENPDIKVKLKVIPWSQKPHDKIQIAIASHTEPDIASMGFPFDKIIADFGAVEPLNKFFPDSVMNDFFHLTKFRGGVASLSWFMDVRALIYRKDYLKAKGIPEPQKSWTWEEFLKYARMLTEDKNRDGITDVFGYGTTLRYAYQFIVFVWQNGGELYSKDGKRATIASKEAVEAIKFYIDLMNKYHISPKFTTENLFVIRKMFAEGKVAMFMDCSDAVNAFLQEPELANKVGVGQIPHHKRYAAYSGTDKLVIFKNARHKKEAVKFLKFLIRKDNLLYYSKKTSFSPPRKSVAQNPYFMNDPIRKAFIEQTKVGRLWELPPFTPSPRQILTRNVQVAVEGKISVEEALKKAEKEMNQEIGSLY